MVYITANYDGSKLHPAHLLVVTALSPLVNLCGLFKDILGAIKYSKKLVAAFDLMYAMYLRLSFTHDIVIIYYWHF